MDTGDYVPPQGQSTSSQLAGPQPTPQTSTNIKRAVEFLSESDRIMMIRSHYLKYRRYVLLEKNYIYASLVELYSIVFRQHWHKLRRLKDSYTLPMGITQDWTYLARVYISSWFMDLYVSNREAVMKLSSLAFNERYHTEAVHDSTEYDDFLVSLSASIRPTHISLVMEDVLYIPIIADNPDFDSDNPFIITNFHRDPNSLSSLLDLLTNDKSWKMSKLTSNTIGRPCWLFDWFTSGEVCSFFPPDSNYSLDDVALAYIIGVACTPRLGPRDIDDWQYYPKNKYTKDMSRSDYERVTNRHFYGSYEVETLTTDPDYTLLVSKKDATATPQPSRKSKRTKTQALIISEPTEKEKEEEETEYPCPRFRITNWTYHHLLFKATDGHTRTGAHRIIALN
nr:capsid protein [Mute swan feces associated partitiviridae 1]